MVVRLWDQKYRGPIPEARTKYEAEQAEIKIKRDVFEGKDQCRHSSTVPTL